MDGEKVTIPQNRRGLQLAGPWSSTQKKAQRAKAARRFSLNQRLFNVAGFDSEIIVSILSCPIQRLSNSEAIFCLQMLKVRPIFDRCDDPIASEFVAQLTGESCDHLVPPI